MKATDLMIGDWVVYNGDVEYTDPIKIEGMDIATDMLITSDREDVGFEGVEPIPLTGEILEKNGFVNGILRVFATPFLRQRVWSKVEVYEYKPYRIGKQINAYRLTIGGKESSGVDIHINHVHELQHAFRLCGIEKEIKL